MFSRCLRKPLERCLSLAALVVLSISLRCPAVIVEGDPGRLTDAPTGDLANSGWQYEGEWGAFTGTPIASDYFITAAHIGGGVNQTFTYDGVDYTTVAEYSDPDSDLRIWKVDGTFSNYATLDLKKNEAGKQAIIFGRGTDRGDAITVNNQVRGWEWGATDYSLSWGTNKISAAKEISGDNLLEYKFTNSKSKPDTGTISEGDSGGGVFVKVGKTWELAGVNFSATSLYSTDPDYSDSFSASLLNGKGFYTFNSADQAELDKSSQPSTDYATRISTESKWIESVLDGKAMSAASSLVPMDATPEPGVIVLSGTLIAVLCTRRFGGGRRLYSLKK